MRAGQKEREAAGGAVMVQKLCKRRTRPHYPAAQYPAGRVCLRNGRFYVATDIAIASRMPMNSAAPRSAAMITYTGFMRPTSCSKSFFLRKPVKDHAMAMIVSLNER